MNKNLLLLTLLFVISPAVAEVTIDLEFDRLGGWGWDSQMFALRCIDTRTGEIVFVEDELTAGQTYKFKVDKNKHRQIMCYVTQWYTNSHYTTGPAVFRKKIELSNMWENGWLSNRGRIPSGDEIGDCGDGEISGMEKCDTNGNKGCAPPSGKCYKCQYCGCEKTEDCPKTEGPKTCGYGRCGRYETPEWYSYCYDGDTSGICMSAYRCRYNPDCLPGEMRAPVKKNETEDAHVVHETDISSSETMEKKVNVIAFEDHPKGGKDIGDMIFHINSGLQQAPDFTRAIFGNEKMNIYANDTKLFLATQGGKVVEAGEGELIDQSMNIYTDAETVEQLRNGELDFFQAIEGGKIRCEGSGAINSLKFTVLNFIFRFFAPQAGAS